MIVLGERDVDLDPGATSLVRTDEEENTHMHSSPRFPVTGPRRKRPSRILPVLVGVTLVLAGCAQSAAPVKDELVVGQVEGEVSFAGCANGVFHCDAVYDQLLRADNDLEHRPGLATEWSYNSDRTVLSVALREDVVFTDGAPFDGDAVKANFDYLGAGPYAFFYAKLDRVEVVGSHVVEFHLTEPDALFVQRLGWIAPMVSPSALGDPDALVETPVGTGPYVLDVDNTLLGVEYHFSRNEDYWDPSSFAWDSLVVKLLPDPTARLNALISGEVDFAAIDASAGAQAQEAGLEVFEVKARSHGMYILDPEGVVTPALADLRVRQAINMAVDREGALEQLLYGYGEVTSQPFPSTWPQHVAELEDEYPYDPDAARELLQEAGYADGFDLVIPVYAGSVADLWGPLVQQSLLDIGIRVTYEQFADFNEWFTAVRAGEFSAIIWSPSHAGGISGRFTGDNSSLRPFDWDERDSRLSDLISDLAFNLADAEAASEFGRHIFELAITPTWVFASTLYGAAPGLTYDEEWDLPYPQLEKIGLAQ